MKRLIGKKKKSTGVLATKLQIIWLAEIIQEYLEYDEDLLIFLWIIFEMKELESNSRILNQTFSQLLRMILETYVWPGLFTA